MVISCPARAGLSFVVIVQGPCAFSDDVERAFGLFGGMGWIFKFLPTNGVPDGVANNSAFV